MNEYEQSAMLCYWIGNSDKGGGRAGDVRGAMEKLKTKNKHHGNNATNRAWRVERALKTFTHMYICIYMNMCIHSCMIQRGYNGCVCIILLSLLIWVVHRKCRYAQHAEMWKKIWKYVYTIIPFWFFWHTAKKKSISFVGFLFSIRSFALSLLPLSVFLHLQMMASHPHMDDDDEDSMYTHIHSIYL